MPTTSATGRTSTLPPSAERPVLAKYRQSQAEKLATQQQQEARRKSAPAITKTSTSNITSSGLGRNIDIKA